ncbi:MAG TPA: CBS domain-containing protein [Phycisphaerae bacterium]|nr:CBS domain-containing protein [Phycisphaerae bacterium]HOI55262.1 CBS domain-containing protein [Phycisphaerae bacterium]
MLRIHDILRVKQPDVVMTSPEITVTEAAQIMSRAVIGSIVVRDGDTPVGIFTERDLLQRVVAVGRDPHTTRLGDVMSSPVKTCRLDEPVDQCALRLKKGHFRHLAVVQDGRLVGLISLRDVMAAQLKEDDMAFGEIMAAELSEHQRQAPPR